MSEMVGNPEDRFSHDMAHLQKYKSISINILPHFSKESAKEVI